MNDVELDRKITELIMHPDGELVELLIEIFQENLRRENHLHKRIDHLEKNVNYLRKHR